MTDWTRRKFIYKAAMLAGSATLAHTAIGLAAVTEISGQDAKNEIAFKSAIELAGLLKKKHLSSVELTRHFIRRIEKYDEKLNAIVVRDFERALNTAATADQARSRGNLFGPLHGVPMTIKESFDIAGLPSTWGIPDAAQNIVVSDAAVVSSFKRAGAHFMGKTNVPLRLSDFQSYNDIYGTTGNPWDPGKSPGGSSGGTAAALAAGLTGLDCGSDIGGSIRNPAHYCGVYGHKPTWGIIPAQGQAPPGFDRVTPPDLAVNGPLARSAEDLALALDIIASPHTLTAPGWKLNLPNPRMTTLKKLRVALWPDEPIAGVDSEISDRIVNIGSLLARLGATVSDSARPDISISESHQTYLTLLRVITAGPEGNIDHQSWMGLDARRAGYRLRWQQFFRDWDILLCPISATTAFPHDHSPKDKRTINVNGEQVSYWDQLFWAGIANLAYLPSTVFPTGLSKNGLPIGLQAIGAEFDDRTTIEFTRLMAQEIGGFVTPPGYGG